MAYLTIFKCFIYETYKLNTSLKTLVRAKKACRNRDSARRSRDDDFDTISVSQKAKQTRPQTEYSLYWMRWPESVPK